MIKRVKGIICALGLSLMLAGCASTTSTATTEAENSQTTTVESTSSVKETTTAAPETTEKVTETEDTAEETTTEKETIEETTEEVTTEEITTAEVETGETNENGIVDGQDVGPVETVAPPVTGGEIVSPFPYLIKVNRYANCVTVYAKDSAGFYKVPVKSMVCSCGRAGHETPLGTFQLKERYGWRALFGNVFGMYATRIQGSILFHSVPYYVPNNSQLEIHEYDKLGAPASLGCIRLKVEDAKWIFENCATGTFVQIYDSADPGPLGKPSAMKIGNAYGVYRGWDPTDPNPANPWVIYGDTYLGLSTHEKERPLGENFDPAIYVATYTAYGQPSNLEITGKVDVNKVGSYKIIYSVTNSAGKKISDYIVFKVVDKKNNETTAGKETKPVETTEKETTVKETTAKETTTEIETNVKETTVAVTTTEETTVIVATTTEEPTTTIEVTTEAEATTAEAESEVPTQEDIIEQES